MSSTWAAGKSPATSIVLRSLQEEQEQHLTAGIGLLRMHYTDIPIIGLWLDENQHPHEIVTAEQSAATNDE